MHGYSVIEIAGLTALVIWVLVMIVMLLIVAKLLYEGYFRRKE